MVPCNLIDSRFVSLHSSDPGSDQIWDPIDASFPAFQSPLRWDSFLTAREMSHSSLKNRSRVTAVTLKVRDAPEANLSRLIMVEEAKATLLYKRLLVDLARAVKHRSIVMSDGTRDGFSICDDKKPKPSRSHQAVLAHATEQLLECCERIEADHVVTRTPSSFFVFLLGSPYKEMPPVCAGAPVTRGACVVGF